MTRSSISRGLVASFVLCLLTCCSCWPAANGAPSRDAQTAVNPLYDLTEPATGTLESAFSLVGQGQVPSGYPQPNLDARVPPTLLKAVAWTESTWRQFTAPGATLVSYDGGYGLMQITSGMAPGGLPDVMQSAIAHNFIYNIDYGASMLVDKFLHTPNIGNDDPSILEHWYYALWAYNGWGWVNNPNNPAFTRIGTPVTNPSAFPYQERVFYWIAHPPLDASGAPLWPAIPVTLPPASEIGAVPGPLPETSDPHADVALPVQSLNLGGGNDSAFLYDVSIPDGTVVQPGARMEKTWLLRNRGAHAWGPGYSWVPIAGATIDASQPISVPVTPPLADVAISAEVIAPRVPGYYRQYWQMRGPDGTLFGVKAWVDFRVTASAVPQQQPAAPPPNSGIGSGGLGSAGLTNPQPGVTPVTAQASYVQQRPASVSALNGDDAIYAGDVSVPDGTVFAPGQRFVKTWRIRNIGTHAWSSAYHWHFEAGSQLSNVQSVAVPATAPGSLVQLSVPMTAPAQTGVYTSFWQMTDSTGQIFGHQAWVSIVVRNGGGKATASPLPTGTASATTMLTATPTATPPPAPTRQPAAPTAVPLATLALPGGDGRLTGSAWTGALTYRTYYAAGTTAGSSQESIYLYYPGPSTAHLQVNLYRPDAAHRTLGLALPAGTGRVLHLNRIAPDTSLAVEILADRRVASERVLSSKQALIGDPGASRTARYWWFPALPTGSPTVGQNLVFFNPHDGSTTVTVSVGRAQGGCCARIFTVSVPSRQQYTFRLPGSDTTGPLALAASSVVTVERIVAAADGTVVDDIPGTVVTAAHWFMPAAVAGVNGSAAALFNPGKSSVAVTVHIQEARGPAQAIQRTVPSFSEVEVPLSGTSTATPVSVQVDAAAPIVGALRTPAGAVQVVTYLGSIAAGRDWLLLGGLAGRGSSQSLTIFNPGSEPSAVTLQVARGPASTTLRVTVQGHSRATRTVGANGGAITVVASAPVVVSRSLVDGNGGTISTGTAVAGG